MQQDSLSVQNKEHHYSFLNVFLQLCDNRPPDGHSNDRPRDAALREHHGQIHHPAPPAQLPHRSIQQAAAHREHAGVR